VRIARPLLPLLSGTLLLAMVAAPVQATLSPNTSLFLYRPGHAITATLSGGVYTRKRSFLTTGWTAAAASRDTLALYNANTGKLKLGTFRNGIFTPTRTTTTAKGYTAMTASCDTIMFYKSSTGRAVTATLTGGHMGTKTAYGLGTGYQMMAASCDSVWMQAVVAAAEMGKLAGGSYSQTYVGTGSRLVAATDDSMLSLYSLSTTHGEWSTFFGGHANCPCGDAHGFGPWDMIAGTSDSVLFYTSDGTAARATLANAAYSYVGPGPNLAAGMTIIAGGK
jgi:hypothetical protein